MRKFIYESNRSHASYIINIPRCYLMQKDMKVVIFEYFPEIIVVFIIKTPIALVVKCSNKIIQLVDFLIIGVDKLVDYSIFHDIIIFALLFTILNQFVSSFNIFVSDEL